MSLQGWLARIGEAGRFEVDGARQNGSLRRQQKRGEDEKRGEAVLETEEVHCE